MLTPFLNHQEEQTSHSPHYRATKYVKEIPAVTLRFVMGYLTHLEKIPRTQRRVGSRAQHRKLQGRYSPNSIRIVAKLTTRRAVDDPMIRPRCRGDACTG